MGHSPPRHGPKPLTRLQLVIRHYVLGRIELEAFETLAGELIASGRENEIAPPPPPKKTLGMAVSREWR